MDLSMKIKIIDYDKLPEVDPDRYKEGHLFNVGDRVQWWSNGTMKVGEVVFVISAGSPVMFEKECEFSYRAVGNGGTRAHESYVVAVDKKIGIKRRECYWPNIIWLKKA